MYRTGTKTESQNQGLKADCSFRTISLSEQLAKNSRNLLDGIFWVIFLPTRSRVTQRKIFMLESCWSSGDFSSFSSAFYTKKVALWSELSIKTLWTFCGHMMECQLEFQLIIQSHQNPEESSLKILRLGDTWEQYFPCCIAIFLTKLIPAHRDQSPLPHSILRLIWVFLQLYHPWGRKSWPGYSQNISDALLL